MSAIVSLIQTVFLVLQLAILLEVLFSWIRPNPYNPFVRIVNQIAGLVLDPLRRFVPPFGMMDITPIIALILLSIVEQVVIGLLVGALR